MQAKIIEISSFAMMPLLAHSRGHCHCSHWESRSAVHPHDPEASVWPMKSGDVQRAGWRRMLSPFQDYRKMCHQSRSDWNAAFSLVKKCICWSFAVNAYISETNVPPALTTLVVCWRVPNNDNISHLVAFHFNSQAFITFCVLESLYSGNLISIQLIYNMIPKNDKVVMGPSKFSDTYGTPNSLYKAINKSRFCWHTENDGGPMVR